jgi:23S rRNA (cytosine1962-C5)-methyltransferase
MFEPAEYELLDFGGGRKLEQFGGVTLDRPSPVAESSSPQRPEIWKTANARFVLGLFAKNAPSRGHWIINHELPVPWIIRAGELKFQLKLSDFGHVGVFPEQTTMWDWIADQGAVRTELGTKELQVINLFAYTGGSTMAAATAGMAVTHVDAVRNAVAWARKNTELSGLNEAPIRWIVEDALTFARRELKRGRKYDAVILDPPSYGHGPSGEVWKIETDLPELLATCRELTEKPRFALLTCHAPQYDPPRLVELLRQAGFGSTADFELGDLWLESRDGRRLHGGMFARFAR